MVYIEKDSKGVDLSISDRALRSSAALLVFVVGLVVYLMTMAVTVSFWDAGEFISVSYILGIPHSPGTPLYVLVGRVFTMLPLPMSVAQKVNFLSVLTASLGVLMAFLVSSSTIRFMYGRPRTAVGRVAHLAGPLAGAFFLMFSDTYWTNAIEAEVYALSAFVMGLCTFLALKWLGAHTAAPDEPDEPVTAEEEGRSRGLVLLIVYLLALGIGFHLGTILVYGGIFLMILMVGRKSFSNFEFLVITFGMAVLVADMTLYRDTSVTLLLLAVFALLLLWTSLSKGRFALQASLLFILGLSVHLFMYIRSAHDPAIDMVDPETWDAMYAHLRREQYPPMDIFTRKASLGFQIRHFAGYFGEQFRLLGDVRLGPLNIGAASSALALFLGLLGIVANWLREKKTWVLNFTALVLNSAGLIIFLNFSDAEVRERDYFYGAAFYFFSIFIGIGASALLVMFREELARAGRKALGWVSAAAAVLVVLSIMPAGYHWFEHDRSKNWIPRDYGYNMLATLEPDAIIFTNGDNDTYPLWYIQTVEGFRTDVRVVTLSLLNTDWYIKQMRDREPAVPISLTDAEIERLRPQALRGGGVAWKKDLAVQHIIQETNWGRPVYFAVTVPPESWKPYSDYLQMQGMVRRLVPVKDKYQVSEFLLERNFEEIFLFRGVLTEDLRRDESVYKSGYTDGMFQNFAVAAMELARLNALDKDFEGALKWTEVTAALKPDFEFPDRVLGLYYARTGQVERGIEHYEGLLREDPGKGEYWLGLSRIFEENGEIGRAIEILRQGTTAAPAHRDLFAHGFYVSAKAGRVEDARRFVEMWLARNPSDSEFQQLREDFDLIMYEEFGIGTPPADSMP